MDKSRLKKNTDYHAFILRVPKENFLKLQKISDEELESINLVINKIIAKHLKQM